MKALRDIAAVAESQPTPATLPHLQHSQYSVVAPLCVCELKRFAWRLHLPEDWQVNLACTEYGGGTVIGNCSCKEKEGRCRCSRIGKIHKILIRREWIKKTRPYPRPLHHAVARKGDCSEVLT